MFFIIEKLLLIGGGFAFLYIVWRKLVILLGRLSLLCVSNRESGTEFNTANIFWYPLFLGIVLGMLLGRLWWLLSSGLDYSQVTWSIFPFVKVEGRRIWFEFWPYRVLRLTEGINAVLAGVVAVLYLALRLLWFFWKVRRRPCVQGRLRTDLSRGIIQSLFILLLILLILIPLLN